MSSHRQRRRAGGSRGPVTQDVPELSDGLELGSAGFRAVFDAAPDGMAIVDQRGRIRDVNAQLEVQFGYTRVELLGSPVEMLVPDAARESHQRHRRRYADHPYPRPMGVGMELRGQRSDGTLFPVEISLSPLETETGSFVISTVRDVTARRRLRDFSVSTLRAVEDERLRLAQELHDDTAQQLASLLLRLRVARSSSGSRDLERTLDGLRDAISECADGVRRIARGLRPPALQDAGVVAAIRAHATRLTEAAGIELMVDAGRVEGVLGSDASLVLYRVVQEALSNVLRHAEASHVEISVRREAGQVVAFVRDDGSGMDPELASRLPGLGIIGMSERAGSVGGSIEIDSARGRGTCVTIRIPVPEGAPSDE